MIDHDRLFKELISTFFLEFIDLFFPQVRAYIDDASIDFLDKEIFTDVTSGERHEVDLVAKLRFAGMDSFFLIHIETQAQHQPSFAERMFNYFARLSQKYGLPVYPIGVLTFNEPIAPQPHRHIVKFPDMTVMDFCFRIVQLNGLDWREFARRENPVASALMAKMHIASEDRPRVRLACIRLLATLKLNRAKMQVILGFIDTYLRLSEQEEKTYQAELEQLGSAEKERVMEVTILWKEEGRLEGLQQGRQEGRQEGRQLGRQEGMSALILRLIDKRIGSVGPEARRQITELTQEQLERLSDALDSFSGPGDLANWLQKLPS
ncbi:MAG TPA: DUF4351 domain-containing protein [Blastocatellia bacterium]